MILCGKCGKATCECAEIANRHPAEWATGLRLDALAKEQRIERAPGEPDDTLRSRVQLSIVHGQPYRSGIPGGKILDRQAFRAGLIRLPGESDPRFLARWMMTVLGRKTMPRPESGNPQSDGVPSRPYLQEKSQWGESSVEKIYPLLVAHDADLISTGEMRRAIFEKEKD